MARLDKQLCYIAPLLVFFGSVTFVWYLFTRADRGTQITITESKYDYLYLALQWGPGVCYQESKCARRVPPDWTIHGLWPSSSKSPQNCALNCTLKVKQLKSLVTSADLVVPSGDLVQELKRHWPNLYEGNWNSEGFWEHEYCKHGTCCADILHRPADYFREVVQLFRRAGVGQILTKADIIPNTDKGYSLSAVDKALSHGLKVKNIKYSCRSVAGKQVLSEVKVCVSKSLKLSDCPNQSSSKCGDIVYIVSASSTYQLFLSEIALIFAIFMVF